MSYRVKLTEPARRHLKEILNYIINRLKSPETAKHWLSKIKSELQSLKDFSHRYPLVSTEPWNKRSFRKLTVRNFIVYYFIEDDKKIVWVVAVAYGGRDQLLFLKNLVE